MFNKIARPAMFLFVCVFRCYFFKFFRLTIIVSHVFITVSLCDVRLSHLNKDYLLLSDLDVDKNIQIMLPLLINSLKVLVHL